MVLKLFFAFGGLWLAITGRRCLLLYRLGSKSERLFACVIVSTDFAATSDAAALTARCPLPPNRSRRGGTGAGLFDPPSSATAAGHTPVKAAPSRPSLERQQSHQQRATPMYLAPTASSRHKHKPKTTNSKAEASHPAKTEVINPHDRLHCWRVGATSGGCLGTLQNECD